MILIDKQEAITTLKNASAINSDVAGLSNGYQSSANIIKFMPEYEITRCMECGYYVPATERAGYCVQFRQDGHAKIVCIGDFCSFAKPSGLGEKEDV